MVFDLLRNTSTEGQLHELHKLLLVSNTFRSPLEPLLYKTITQHDLYKRDNYTPKPKAIGGLFRTFLLNPRLASHVRSIYIEEVDVDHDLFTMRSAELTDKERYMAGELVRRKDLSSIGDRFQSTGNMDLNAVLGLILGQLSNLQSLELVLWYGRLEGYVSRSNLHCLQTLDLSWQSAGFRRDLADEGVPQGPVATLRHLVKATGVLRSVKITAYYGPIRPGLTADIEADVEKTRDILSGYEDTLRVKDLSFVEDPLHF